MDRKPVKRILSGWIGIAIILAVHPVSKSLTQTETTIDPAFAATILRTTVQIKLYIPKQDLQTYSIPRAYILADSLGTLAKWQGETVIVTHNHWDSMLNEAEFVLILDSQGNITHELSGIDFRALVRYQNTGTMILAAPACQVEGCYPYLADIGDQEDVAPGDFVVFVHQAAVEDYRLASHPAQVAALSQYKATGVFKLRSLEGQKIIAGDSGGGIWFDGRLVGNIWGRFNVQGGEAGYAARFPSTAFSKWGCLRGETDSPRSLPESVIFTTTAVSVAMGHSAGVSLTRLHSLHSGGG